MTLELLAECIDAKIINGKSTEVLNLEYAFASDLMSDVLTIDEHDPVLITGLSNLQTIRTAEMADIRVIILARGKKASTEMISLADESGIILLETPYSVFKTSGLLFAAGIKPLY